jgi:hypothetical protein
VAVVDGRLHASEQSADNALWVRGDDPKWFGELLNKVPLDLGVMQGQQAAMSGTGEGKKSEEESSRGLKQQAADQSKNAPPPPSPFPPHVLNSRVTHK